MKAVVCGGTRSWQMMAIRIATRYARFSRVRLLSLSRNGRLILTLFYDDGEPGNGNNVFPSHLFWTIRRPNLSFHPMSTSLLDKTQ
jgi:hypothetical protein